MNNIHKIYLVSAFSNLSFGYSLWMLYLQEFGLSFFEVAILQSILNLAMFIFEIPTGLLADKYGEKQSIVWSCALLLCYSLAMAIFPANFIVQSCGFFLAGIAYALFSGANESLLYKSISEYNLKSQKTKIIGMNTAISNWSLVIAISVGGIISTYKFEMVFYLMAIAFFIALLVSMTIDNIIKLKGGAIVNMGIESDVHLSLAKAILSLRVHVINIISFIFIIALVSLFFIYGQEIINEQTDNKMFIGVVFSVALMLEGFSNVISHKVEHKLKLKSTLILSLVLMMCCFALLIYSNLIAFICSILITSVIFGILDPQIVTYINSVCGNKYRTTINSIFNSLSTIVMMIVGPVVAWYSEITNYKISFIFAMTAIVLCVFSILLIVIIDSKKSRLNIDGADM